MKLKIKLAKESYTIDTDTLSLGECALLKRDYGMDDFLSVNFLDPEQILGLCFISVRRKHPDWTDEQIRRDVEAIPGAKIAEQVQQQIIDAVKAAEEGGKANGAEPASNGGQATPQSKAGTPRTRKGSASKSGISTG